MKTQTIWSWSPCSSYSLYQIIFLGANVIWRVKLDRAEIISAFSLPCQGTATFAVTQIEIYEITFSPSVHSIFN